MTTSEIDLLIADLKNQDWLTRTQAKARLLEIGPGVIDGLIGAMKQGDKRQQYEAANMLTRFHDIRCYRALSDALYSSNMLVAQLVPAALLAYGKQQAIDSLLIALPQVPHFVQLQIVMVFREYGGRQVVQPLMATLKTAESPILSYTIIETLGELGDRRAIGLIRQFQQDNNHHVRERVKVALEKLTVNI